MDGYEMCTKYEREPKMIARWESPNGKQWMELYRCPTGYYYKGNLGFINNKDKIMTMELIMERIKMIKMERAH